MLVMFPLLIATMAAGTGLIAAGFSYYFDVTGAVTSPEEAIAARGGGARIYDRNGVLLYEFLDEQYGIQRRLDLDEVSPLVRTATIASEDASFYSNPGLNVRGLTRAALENLRPGDDFFEGTGGSSITQQLVKQLYFTPEERRERSVARKIKEAALAVRLTRDYSKDQILEWYLNEIPYGGVLIGIGAASEGYFNKPASDVTLAQAAFLAGLPQSPGEYDPFTNFDRAKTRQHEVLDLMAKHKFITQEEANWAKLEVIELTPAPRPFLAPHFVNYVGDYIKATLGEAALYHGGLEVWTTLDLELQTQANEILERHLQTYEQSTQGHNGSVVIIEPPTGQILAMVGSRDYFREDIDGTVNNALALNSPGSTLKPFTYATALMKGWSPEWPIVDTTIDYRVEGQEPFSPRNPDGRNRGVVPMKVALGNSFNITAFKTILWTGVDEMLAVSKRMGITTLDRDLGPATTLGGVDVKLIDMVYGYSTFANSGVMVGVPAWEPKPEGNRQLDPVPVVAIRNKQGEVIVNNADPEYRYAIGPEYAYMITDILSADANRQITYGRGSNLNIPGWRVAVKTGTSEPYERSGLIGDTWTIGYTPNIAVGVWVGNSDNTPMVNIFSTTIAGQTWHDTMVTALDGRPKQDWERPEGLVEATVCVPSGRIPARGESCPTVRGTFARDALERANKPEFWGGETVSSRAEARSIPGDVSGWKRYLAEEYLRMYRGGSSPTRTSSPRVPERINPPPDRPIDLPEGAGRPGNGNRGRGGDD